MPKRYDYTSGTRKKRQHDRIKQSGLCNRLVVMHPDDVEDIRRIAKRKYKRRGVDLIPLEDYTGEY